MMLRPLRQQMVQTPVKWGHMELPRNLSVLSARLWTWNVGTGKGGERRQLSASQGPHSTSQQNPMALCLEPILVIFISNNLCVCVCLYMELRGQLEGTGYQVWPQALFRAETSCYPYNRPLPCSAIIQNLFHEHCFSDLNVVSSSNLHSDFVDMQEA